MKKITVALISAIALLLFTEPVDAQRITVPKNADGGWYYQYKPFPAKPGDTVIVDGTYQYSYIYNLKGTEDKKIVFKSSNPLVMPRFGVRNTGNAFILANCEHIVIDGIDIGGDTDSTYMEQTLNMGGSSDIEVRNCIIRNGKVGIYINPGTGHYKNLYIHHNTFRNISDLTKKLFSEAIYIGRTNNVDIGLLSFTNTRVEYNEFYDIGGDVIQLANNKDAIIKGNRIYNYSMHNIRGQQWGLFFGGASNGIAEGNYLEKGTGAPFGALGVGNVVFSNNIAKGCATSYTEPGFYLRGQNSSLKVKLYNNVIDKVSTKFVDDVTGSLVDSSGNIFGTSIPDNPQPPTKVDSVPKAKYDSLLAAYEVAVAMYNGCSNNLQYLQSQYNNVLANLNVANNQYNELKARIEELKKEIENVLNKF